MANYSTDAYTQLHCDNCIGCVSARYSDCVQCDACNLCYNSSANPDPPALKSHSMLYDTQGVIIYGGAHWT